MPLLIAEDEVSKAALLKIIETNCRQIIIPENDIQIKRGKSTVLSKITGYNQAAKLEPVFIIVDADNETPCKMLPQIFPYGKHPNLVINIAVKETETWLLADRIEFKKYLGTTGDYSDSNIDQNISDPKQIIFDLARNSRKKTINKGIPPQTDARIGREYNPILIKFINSIWDPNRAKMKSASLNKCIHRITAFNYVNSSATWQYTQYPQCTISNP